VSFDLSPVSLGKAIGGFAFDQQGPLMLMADMRHQLRVAKLAVRHDDWRRQLEPTAPQGGQAFIAHRLRPTQFVPARRSGPDGIRPPNGKIHWRYQLPIANDHHQ
jgi:hypothetical protein